MRGACEDGIYKHAEGNLAEYADIKGTNFFLYRLMVNIKSKPKKSPLLQIRSLGP